MENTGTITLNTNRLILRRIYPADAENFYKLLTDEQVLKYISGIPVYTCVDMAVSYVADKLTKKYKNKNFYDWGIALATTNELIGRVSLCRQDDERRMADLCWFIRPEYRGNGYVTEAVKKVIEHLLLVGFERIEAFADVENFASERVMQKVGMTYEGTLRAYDLRRYGSLYDAKMYSIINRQ